MHFKTIKHVVTVCMVLVFKLPLLINVYSSICAICIFTCRQPVLQMS